MVEEVLSDLAESIKKTAKIRFIRTREYSNSQRECQRLLEPCKALRWRGRQRRVEGLVLGGAEISGPFVGLRIGQVFIHAARVSPARAAGALELACRGLVVDVVRGHVHLHTATTKLVGKLEPFGRSHRGDCSGVDLLELFRHFRACHGASIEERLSVVLSRRAPSGGLGDRRWGLGASPVRRRRSVD